MKLCIILMIAATLQASADVVAQRVSLHIDGQDMKAVIQELQRQTGYSFAFKGSVLKKTRPVTISLDSVGLMDALAAIEKQQPVKFSIVAGTVVMNERNDQPSAAVGISGVDEYMQRDTGIDRSYVLRGVVLGIGDAPLQEVSVVNERTKRGTLTSPSGEFVIREIGQGDVISFSYVGYSRKRVTITDLKYTEVKLEPAVSELDAVQVEGYRVNSRRMSTSNIVTIRAADIEKQPVANPLQALQGKVPGLEVTATGGTRRGSWDVLLRGLSAIDRNASQGPLFIVDGVPITVLALSSENLSSNERMGFDQGGFAPPGGETNGQSPMYSINPADIESISILKDPDALAVYGSRGGRGVILITTKRGLPGKTKLEVSASSGLSFVTKFYDMLNTTEYVAMRKEALANDGLVPDNMNAYDFRVWDTARYTNWQKVFWGGVGKNIEADMNISGGDKMTTFRISGNYSFFSPLNSFTGDDQRITNHININHASLNRRLKLSFTNYFSFAKTTLIELYGSALLPPNAPPIFDNEGQLNYKGWAPVTGNYDFGRIINPFSAKTTYTNSQITVNYNLATGVNFSGNFGYSQNNQNAISVTTIASQNPAFAIRQGASTIGNSGGSRMIAEPQLEYRTFIGKGEFSTMVGTSYQIVTQRGAAVFGSGFVNDALLRSIENAPFQFGSNIEGEYRYAAMFGRVTYNYNKKYLANVTGRRDGSSRFANGKNFGNFYSVGLGYIFSEEDFFKRQLPFISLGKIRGAYGLTGSDNISDYQYITRWAKSSTTAANYNGSVVYLPVQHSNPNLQWQVDKKIDISMELGFLKDAIHLNVGWYRNRTGNQLVQYFLPAMTGFGGVTANFPALVENQGWEWMVNCRIVQTKDLLWSLNLNGGLNRNKLVEFPGLETSSYRTIYEVGQPLSIAKVLHYTGVDPQTGFYTVEDKNKDGIIDQLATNSLQGISDLYVFDLTTKMDGGFGTDLSYKGLNASVYFQYKIKNGASAFFVAGPAGGIQNASRTAYEGRWKSPGDHANFARLTTRPGDQSFNDFQASDGVYSDASFIRLNNVALSYEVPAIICKRIGLRHLNIFLRGQNLAIFTKYEGADPETRRFGAFPPLSTTTFGFKLSL